MESSPDSTNTQTSRTDPPQPADEPIENPFVGKTFKCQQAGYLFENSKTKSYRIAEWKPPRNRPDFGAYITFGNESFEAYNSTLCGNDIFIRTEGTYSLLPGDRVRIFVTSITRNEYCDKPSEAPNRSFGEFQITFDPQQPGLIQLQKISPEPSD